MAISTTTATLVNSTQLGGTQTGVQTAGLSNGGYVVAWNSDLGGQKDVYFQRYDALGIKLGGPVLANATVAGDQELTDILVRADGSFVLSWSKAGTVTTRGFDGSTGAALTGESNVAVVGTSATGAQIILTDASNYKVVMSSDSGANTVIEQVSFFANGAANGAKSTVSSFAPTGVFIREVVDGNNTGTQFILLSDGTVMSSANGTKIDGNGALDIIKLQDGLHVLGGEIFQNAVLTGLFGTGNKLNAYQLGDPQYANLDDPDAVNTDIFSGALVNLDGNRILAVGAVDTGTTNTSDFADGIYAVIFNESAEQFESAPILIKDMGLGDEGEVSDLSKITVSAELLSDGRVAISWSENGGLAGFDVYSAILDPRTDGNGHFTRAATEGDDLLIVDARASSSTLSGGGGDDTIVGFSGRDSLDGGDGNDVIDAGDGNDSIEGADGRDFIAGAGGNDWILGGAGRDVINPGDGDDIVDGGDGNDTIAGGGGMDVLDGGNGVDTVTFADAGGGYTDLEYDVSPLGTMDGFDRTDDVLVNFENIIGSSGADYLAGNAGANVLRGAGGEDYLQGRGGADRMRGGAGGDGFVYEFATEGGDTIGGFEIGSDKIAIVSENFGGIDEQSILASLNINSSGNPQSGGAKFTFDNSGAGAGALYFDPDGSGAALRVLLATIRFSDDLGISLFSATDFEFI